MDNKKPVFLLKDFKVSQARVMGQNGAHLKLKLEQDGQALDLVAFNMGVNYKSSNKHNIWS